MMGDTFITVLSSLLLLLQHDILCSIFNNNIRTQQKLKKNKKEKIWPSPIA